MGGMSPIVKTVTRWVVAFIFLFGVYVVLTGHLSPGGGFPGGVLIAGSFVLLMLAYGKKDALGLFSQGLAGRLDSAGALAFLVVGLIGILIGGSFLGNFIQHSFPGKDFHLFSAGNIPVVNVAIGLKVGASLFLIFTGLSLFRLLEEEEGREED